MVEAAGIEPASESRSPGSPTGVSGRLDLARRPLRPAGSATRQLDWISSAAHERGPWTSLRLSDARVQPHRRGRGDRRRYLSSESQLLVGSCNVPAFLTRSRVPGLHFLALDPRRDLFAPHVRG